MTSLLPELAELPADVQLDGELIAISGRTSGRDTPARGDELTGSVELVNGFNDSLPTSNRCLRRHRGAGQGSGWILVSVGRLPKLPPAA
jgi:hypothetical protein